MDAFKNPGADQIEQAEKMAWQIWRDALSQPGATQGTHDEILLDVASNRVKPFNGDTQRNA